MNAIENYKSDEYETLQKQLHSTQAEIVEGLIFNLPLRFYKKDWTTASITFKNCVFKKVIQLNEVDLNEGLYFENCHFESGFDCFQCSGGYPSRQFGYRDNNLISFKNCQIKNGLNIQQCNFQQGISIGDDSGIDKILLSNCKLPSLLMHDSSITELLEVSKSTFDEGLFYHKAVINALMHVSEIKGDIHFSKTTIHRPIVFDGILSKQINILECSFNDVIELNNCQARTMLQLRGSSFEKKLVIQHNSVLSTEAAPVEELRIDGCEFKAGFDAVSPYQGRTLDVVTVLIDCSVGLKGAINFQNWNIQQVKLKGINQAGISFIYCLINQFVCNDFVNQGSLSLYSIQPLKQSGSFFNVSRSVLGKTFLSNVDLQEYEQIMVGRSNLTEVVTTAVHWFRSEQLTIEPLSSAPQGRSLYHLEMDKVIGILRFQGQKELYRQLKFAMEKQGDNLNRLRFKKEELAAYRNELHYWPLKLDQIGDRLILWLNQSNDFGFNWLKPTLMILILTIVANSILAISVNPNLSWWLDFSRTGETLRYLFGTCYNMFNLLNPAHKVTDLFDIKHAYQPSFFFYFIDFLDRLVVSYLLFQMIIAFRKYST